MPAESESMIRFWKADLTNWSLRMNTDVTSTSLRADEKVRDPVGRGTGGDLHAGAFRRNIAFSTIGLQPTGQCAPRDTCVVDGINFSKLQAKCP